MLLVGILTCTQTGNAVLQWNITYTNWQRCFSVERYLHKLAALFFSGTLLTQTGSAVVEWNMTYTTWQRFSSMEHDVHNVAARQIFLFQLFSNSEVIMKQTFRRMGGLLE
jgi:hypothetical protein